MKDTRSIARYVAPWLPMVIVAVLGLAVWHLTVRMLGLQAVILPAPIDVYHAAIEYRSELITALFSTGAAAAAGLVSAITLGSLIAVAFSQSRQIRIAFFPYVMFLQTVPIVAIAPLLIIWSGYEFRTVVIVTVIICLFPVVNNVTTGLTTIDRQWADLFRLYGTSRLKRLRLLQVPAAIPSLVLGAKTSSGLAVIGAIVADFFVGNGSADYKGLGTLMTGWIAFSKTAPMIAALFASTLLGLVLFGTVHLIARTQLRRWMN
ncbi:MAG: ABC transporter permease subunit [Planctomycetota bacterium]